MVDVLVAEALVVSAAAALTEGFVLCPASRRIMGTFCSHTLSTSSSVGGGSIGRLRIAFWHLSLALANAISSSTSSRACGSLTWSSSAQVNYSMKRV